MAEKTLTQNNLRGVNLIAKLLKNYNKVKTNSVGLNIQFQ